jgi:hypothetical protein
MHASAIALLLLLLTTHPVSSTGISAAGAVEPDQPAATGRVVATITTLEGTMHIPGVQVELRAAADRIVIARR